MPRAESKNIPLTDLSGGLNNRDLPGALRANEASELDGLYTDEGGFPGKQIPGGDVIQYAPIDPSQFANGDADDLALWHLEEASSPFADSGPSGRNLSVVGTATQQTAVFGNGQKLTTPYAVGGSWNDGNLGSALYVGVSNLLNGQAQVCFDAWINIDPSFSGQPVTATLAGTDRTLSDSGAPLVGTALAGGATTPGLLYNGLSIHRDWDAVSGKHSSDPYCKFTLNTNGVAGTQTVIEGVGLPMGKELHIRGEYDSTTGLMTLYVNGSKQAEASVVGGGTINDAASPYLIVGGQGLYFFSPFSGLYQTFRGVISECRISTVARTASQAFPFKKPRPSMKALSRPDGTNQLVTPAGDGLYYTTGDGNWTLIKSGISETAKWDWWQIGDILYGCNGEEAIAWDGASWKTWGNPITPPTLTALGAGAAPAAGTYQVCYTYVYGTEETGPSPAASITLGGTSNISVSDIPPRHNNCSAIRVYRTKDGGSVFYLEREVANDPDAASIELSGPYNATGSPSPTSSSGSLGVADATLGTGEYAEMTAEVAASDLGSPSIITENFDRLFVNDADNRYIVRWTEPGLPDIVFATSFVRARGNLKITGLSKSTGEVQAHKDGRGCLVLRGDGPSNWRQFDNLHPTLGAVDHFGIVYRTVPKREGGSDATEVCIPTPEGWYGYQGYEFYRIDDKIDGTFKTLAQANSTKLEFVTSSQAQFQAAAAQGGSASANVQQNRYESDGLRQEPGSLQIIDQLNYLGLWSNAGALVSGRVTAVAKADGEGCFYFATDATNELYYTPDNFVTVQTIGGTALAAGERIIQIVRRATDDFWFLITDSAGTSYSIGGTVVCKSSGGGRVHAVNDPLGATIGPVWTTGADTLYYDLDVPIRMDGGGTTSSGRIIGRAVLPASSYSPYNAYINHAQTAQAQAQLSAVSSSGWTFEMLSNPSVSASYTGYVFSTGLFLGSTVVTPLVQAGFYSLQGYVGLGGGDLQSIRLDYTRREYPRWRGGTTSPQAFWDATNSRLVFVASGAEDANGNRLSQLRSVTSALALTTYATTNNVSAVTWDGTLYYWGEVERSTPYGHDGYIKRAAVLGTADASTSALGYRTFLRLGYESSSGKLLASWKSLGVNTPQEFYTYGGRLSSFTASNLSTADTALLSQAASGDSGPVCVELEKQTTTPLVWFAAVQKMTVAAVYQIDPTMDATTDVTALEADAYTAPDADDPANGILSNLLFVASSDAAGNYLWSDRLYWQTESETAADGRFVQRGVPGTWEVRASFDSALRNLGVFDALGDFDVDYSGNIAFSVANGDTTPFQSTDFKPVTPNQRINISNAAPGSSVQWAADLTWVYSIAAPTSTPSIEFVTISYFVGDANIPTVAAVHYKGRTRWSVARAGQLNNDLEIIYQKNNGWTTASDRRIVSYAIFRGELVCFEDYTLLRMEKGVTWSGRRVAWRAVTGYIMGDETDKYIRDAHANIMEYSNPEFPTKRGWFIIRPLAAGEPIDGGEWYVPIPATAGTPRPRQVQGEMDPWTHAWARALAIEIKASDDVGDYEPAILQSANIQALLLTLRVSPPRRIMAVD